MFGRQFMLPHFTSADLFTGLRLGFQIDFGRIRPVIEKIVRGIYYFKDKVPLASSHEICVYHGNDFWNDDGFQTLLPQMKAEHFGDDVFSCRSLRDPSGNTAWLLVFYNQLAFFAWTIASQPYEQLNQKEENRRG
jgi:hypothetical protein